MIDEQDDMHVAAEAIDAPSALEAARTVRPDVVVMEMGLPGGRPGDTVRRLASLELALVVVADSDDPDLLASAVSQGARVVLSKTASMTSLAEAIRAARGDCEWLPSGPALTKTDEPGDDWARLTPRERDVARLVAQGLAYRDVAAQLGISDHTVKNHLRRIYDKLDINSRVELAVYGYEG